MFSTSYLLLIAATIAIGAGATFYVNNRLKHYSKVPVTNGMTGAEAARRMLAYYGIQGVDVHRGGEGQDFFDPRSNSISLSPDVYDGRSVTATATACHECGHAYQYAQDYTPMKLRTAIVPAVNAASNAWVFLLMIGIALNVAGFVNLAIVMYAVVVLFSLVTLPVEFDASRRAMVYMGSVNLPEIERKGSFDVLRACALTYVAAALTSILQLVWLLSQRSE